MGIKYFLKLNVDRANAASSNNVMECGAYYIMYVESTPLRLIMDCGPRRTNRSKLVAKILTVIT